MHSGSGSSLQYSFSRLEMEWTSGRLAEVDCACAVASSSPSSSSVVVEALLGKERTEALDSSLLDSNASLEEEK